MYRALSSQEIYYYRNLRIVDNIAYCLLVPKSFLSGNIAFSNGFRLARKWGVPPKIAFLRIMETYAQPGDLAFHLMSIYESPDQLTLFPREKKWSLRWSLAADFFEFDCASRLVIRKGRKPCEFKGGSELLFALETWDRYPASAIDGLKQSLVLRRLLGNRR